MPTISTDRGRMFYRQAAGDNPILIFLHGNLGTSRWWKPVLDRLPPGWRGLAPDAIGFGYSEQPTRLDRFAVSAQVADVAEFADELDLPSFHLIAHSTATPVAVEYALAFPGQVASLVLVGPVPARGIATPPEAYPLLEQMPGNRELMTQALHASLPSIDPESAVFEQLMSDAAETADIAFMAGARALDAWQPEERLRQLTLPVLLVRGEHDIMLGQQEAHETLLAIPGANNLENFPGVGHSPHLESPQAFATSLVDFLTEDWEEYEAVRDSVDE